MADGEIPVHGSPANGGPVGGDEARLRELLDGASRQVVPGDALAAAFGARHRAARRRMRRASGAVATLAVAAVVVLAGVGGYFTPGGSGKPAGPGGGRHPGVGPYQLTGALVSFNGCPGYLAYVKKQAESMVGPYGLQGAGMAPIPMGAMWSPARLNAAAAPAGSTPTGTAVAGTPALAHSETTDQVPGVDEPDTVKTNGRIVVTLTGSTMRVLDTKAHVLGSLQLKGDTGGGMLLDGNTVVVLSTPAPSPSLAQFNPGVAYSMPADFPSNGYYQTGSNQPQQGQAVIIDLSDPSAPRIVRTFRFDGSVLSARLVGSLVRIVLRSDGPRITFETPDSTGGDAAAATAANRHLIATSTLTDWLPTWQVVKPDGSASSRGYLASCNAVSRPRHATGISTVSVFSLGPRAFSPGPATSVVAAGDVVYATAGHVYVAGETTTPAAQSTCPPSEPVSVPAGPSSGGSAPASSSPARSSPVSSSPAEPCRQVYTPPSVTTRIYDFATSGGSTPRFLGAGSVAGTLLNSYSLDQGTGGTLRVVTTLEQYATTGAGYGGPGTAACVNCQDYPSAATNSRITVLMLEGSDLVKIGTVSGLGDGQQLRAVRFIGQMAYVVTYRSFDPLYVVDLHNPSAPKVTGKLEQPGFSEFLYPLPGQRLLGVGVTIGSDNEVNGLVAATYDVSNPEHPVRIDTTPMAKGFEPANEGYDAHAFTWWAPANLAILAIPPASFYGSGMQPVGGLPGAGAVAYHIGSDGHLAQVGVLTHGDMTTTRTAVIGNEVWAFTAGGVILANLSSLQSATWHPYPS